MVFQVIRMRRLDPRKTSYAWSPNYHILLGSIPRTSRGYQSVGWIPCNFCEQSIGPILGLISVVVIPAAKGKGEDA